MVDSLTFSESMTSRIEQSGPRSVTSICDESEMLDQDSPVGNDNHNSVRNYI